MMDQSQESLIVLQTLKEGVFAVPDKRLVTVFEEAFFYRVEVPVFVLDPLLLVEGQGGLELGVVLEHDFYFDHGHVSEQNGDLGEIVGVVAEVEGDNQFEEGFEDLLGLDEDEGDFSLDEVLDELFGWFPGKFEGNVVLDFLLFFEEEYVLSVDDPRYVVKDLETGGVFEVEFEGLDVEENGDGVVVNGVGAELGELDQVGVLAQHRNQLVILGVLHYAVEVARLVQNLPRALNLLLEVLVELLAIVLPLQVVQLQQGFRLVFNDATHLGRQGDVQDAFLLLLHELLPVLLRGRAVAL
jgi:hypothetical protein